MSSVAGWFAMAFQGAPVPIADVPPGIPHPAVPPADITQLVQLMQSQQQQMAAMLNHLISNQNASLPSLGRETFSQASEV